MGPFELVGPILKNPGWFFGLEGNNHHCMFQFMDQWYMAYHTRILEERMGILQNYRSTSIDSVQIDGNGRISSIQATREGVAQTQPFYPYCKHKAVTMAAMGGITTTQYGEDAVKYGSGEMLLTGDIRRKLDPALRGGLWRKNGSVPGNDSAGNTGRLCESISGQSSWHMLVRDSAHTRRYAGVYCLQGHSQQAVKWDS